MGEDQIKSWRELTLQQFGDLLRGFVSYRAGEHEVWKALVDNVERAEPSPLIMRKTAGKNRSGLQVYTTQTLMAYFFTFTAVVHKRSKREENQDFELKDLVKEYHLDWVIRHPIYNRCDFDYFLAGMIPHHIDDVKAANRNPGFPRAAGFLKQKGIQRTDEECVALCWSRILRYLEETDAPKPNTRLIDAFAWLEEKNRQAYTAVTDPDGNFLFNRCDECAMGESYTRLLRQLDNWNPYCMSLLPAYLKMLEDRRKMWEDIRRHLLQRYKAECEGKGQSAWRGMTLLQLGSLLRDSTLNRQGQLGEAWAVLAGNVAREEAKHQIEQKAENRSGFQVNTTQTIMAYFFTFAAAVHRRFCNPGRKFTLKDIVKEYHLDRLMQDPRDEHCGFGSFFSGMIPRSTGDLETIHRDPAYPEDAEALKENRIQRTDEECAALCWSRILRYLEEADAPKPNTRLIDAFKWLEEKNRQAAAAGPKGEPLPDRCDECAMGESCPRFLRQLDDWDPHYRKLWARYESWVRDVIRVPSAELSTEPYKTGAGGENQFNWWMLSLLQLGSLLRFAAVDRQGRLNRDWYVLVRDVALAEAANQIERKAAGKKWSGFQVNTTQIIMAYFFTFAAVVHRRFLDPGREFTLKDIVKEYHLDLLLQDPKNKNFGFDFYFGGMIPHNTLDVELLNRDGTSHWIRRTHEECAALCWSRILRYLEEADAPKPNTRLITAFKWLVEKNSRAYASFTKNGAVMFDYNYECTMGKNATRFLQQLNAPYCEELWSARRMRDRRILREYSPVLDPAADRAGGRRGADHA